jgi:DNA-binding PucR family transcriptional regulator
LRIVTMPPRELGETPARPELAEALRLVSARILAQLDDLAASTAAEVLSDVPELEPLEDGEMWSEEAAFRANVQSIVALMPYGVAAVEPPPVTLERVRRLVHHGIEPQALLRTYRIGHAALWAAWQTEACREAPGVLPEVLEWSSRLMFAYFDSTCDFVARAYAAERARWVRTAAALRAEVTRELLAGSEIDPERASSLLGYELLRHHLGLIIWHDGGDDGVTTAAMLERAAKAVAQHLGYCHPLIVPVGSDQVWAWCGGFTPPSAGALDDLRRLALGGAVRIAAGDPCYGLEGFSRTHREAVITREMMIRTSPATRFNRYSNVALPSLLLADPDRAETFMRNELGPLADDTDAMLRLRATLEIVLGERSLMAAARRIGVHQNTIGYRISRSEQLLGHSIDERRQELEAALIIARALPEQIARSDGDERVTPEASRDGQPVRRATA